VSLLRIYYCIIA